MIHDLRLTLRALRRAPVFSLAVVAMLSLAIGATTTAFTVVDAVVLRGLPYRDAARLRVVYERSDDGSVRVPSYPTFVDWSSAIGATHGAIDGAIDGAAFVRGDGVMVSGASGPKREIAGYVTPGFFAIMGTRARMGRTFSADEERVGAPVAVLSWDFFLRQFGGDASAIGRVIDLSGVPTTIIGVMPHGFAFPNFASPGFMAPAVWQPIETYAHTHPQLALRGLHVDARAVVRLAAGADSARAAAAMHTIQQRLAASYPTEQAHWTSVVFQPLGEELYGDTRSALVLIAGAIAAVLLLACANVANLLLVRASARRRERAVRVALGASRWRVAAVPLLEALVLCVIAGIVGVGLAYALPSAFSDVASGRLAYAAELHVSARVLAFAALLSIGAALIVGLAAGLRDSTRDLMSAMRGAGAAASGGTAERRVRNALVSIQFALALTLLLSAGLLLQSFRRLAAVSLGYDPDGLVTFAIKPPSPTYDAPDAAAALYARVLRAVRAVPGVTSVAAAGGALIPVPVRVDGAADATAPAQALYHPVSTAYLTTMRVPLVAGRWFTDADMRAATGFVISDRLAATLWPHESALGKRISVPRSSQNRKDFGQLITLPVIGVVGSVRESGPSSDPDAEVLLPYTLEVWPWMHFTARVRNPEAALAAIDRAVRGTDPAITYYGDPSVLRGGAAGLDVERRFLTWTVAAFAAGALFLAAIGLYGIVAYGIAQRTRELGVRIALGAPAAVVEWLVVRETTTSVCTGAALGIGGASLAGRVLKSMLFQTSSTDAATLAAVAGLLAIIAFVASYVPARRASRVDPIVVMRAE